MLKSRVLIAALSLAIFMSSAFASTLADTEVISIGASHSIDGLADALHALQDAHVAPTYAADSWRDNLIYDMSSKTLMRGGAVAARVAHNHAYAGSIPALATTSGYRRQRG
jgi:hypothetical protein